MVTEKDALEILVHAERIGVDVRLDGGWGVDALLGRQTRDHDDIDLLSNAGTVRVTQHRCGVQDSPNSSGPLPRMRTVWTDDRGRTIDLHLFETGADGELLFEGGVYPPETFGAQGRIAGKALRYIPHAQLVAFHLGYAHDGNDAHDVRLFCAKFRFGATGCLQVSVRKYRGCRGRPIAEPQGRSSAAGCGTCRRCGSAGRRGW